MPLHYDLSKIKDYETVCYVDTSMGRVLNPVTEALIINDVGIREITAMDSELTFRRHCLLAVIVGAPIVMADGAPRYITQEDVIAHIGLSTNHAKLTDAAFKRAIMETAEEKAKQLRIKYRVKVNV